MKVNIGFYQLDIFRIPSWVTFGHFYASFWKCLSGMTYILGKKATIAISTLFIWNQQKKWTGNSVIFMLLHWYCHRGLSCGKIIKFTFKIFNIFGDVYTRDGTISLCQHDESTQIAMSHEVQYTGFVSIPLTLSLVTKWHDRHRYLPKHHVPYLMSLSSTRHCSKNLRGGRGYSGVFYCQSFNTTAFVSITSKQSYKDMYSAIMPRIWGIAE